MPADLIITKSRRRDLSDARALFIHFAVIQGHDKKALAKKFNMINVGNIDWNIDKVADLVKADKRFQELYSLCSTAIKDHKLEVKTYG